MARKRPAPLAQIDTNSTCDAARVDTRVPIEALVLGRDDGVFQMRAHRVRSDLSPELFAPPRINPPVAVQHRHRATRTAVGQLFNGGNRDRVIKDDTCQCDGPDNARPPANAPDQTQNRSKQPDKRVQNATKQRARRFACNCFLGLADRLSRGFCRLFRSLFRRRTPIALVRDKALSGRTIGTVRPCHDTGTLLSASFAGILRNQSAFVEPSRSSCSQNRIPKLPKKASLLLFCAKNVQNLEIHR